MTQTKKDNKYAIIVAICFILIAINNFVNVIVIYNRLLSIISIGFALSLFLRKPIAATVVFGIEILYSLYLYIEIGFTVYYFVRLLAYIAIFVMFILLFKNNKVVNKIWFLGAILMFIAGIIRWRNLFVLDLYFPYHYYIALGSQLLEVVALLFIGLWIKDFKYEKKQTCKSANTESSLGTADKLELYYELLQSGTITQEEFDAKKKQLLGL